MTHPRPVLDADNRPFWLGCRDRRLMLQRCDACGTWRFPPRPHCPACRSSQASWEQSSGKGEIVSFTICHPPVLPAFQGRTPYDVVVVRLEEGPLIVSNMLDVEPDVGMAVKVWFVDVDDDLTLPQFRKASR
jgi:uncharacterized OB-fold protein